MKRLNIAATPDRKARFGVETDPRWATLKTASSAEIDAYLAANVTTMAQMRPLLRSLLVAVRYLMSKQPT